MTFAVEERTTMSRKSDRFVFVRSTAVQDGVERLHIVAGDAALAYARAQDELVRASSEVFWVHGDDLPKAAARFFKEWKNSAMIEHLESEIVRLRTSGGGMLQIDIDGVRVVVMRLTATSNQ